jgi:hypothetical protein
MNGVATASDFLPHKNTKNFHNTTQPQPLGDCLFVKREYTGIFWILLGANTAYVIAPSIYLDYRQELQVGQVEYIFAGLFFFTLLTQICS